MDKTLKSKKGAYNQSKPTKIVLRDKGTQTDPDTETKGSKGGIKK